jgi:hypothetical protein
LCLVAEVAYGANPSYTDPVRYSFAHGGKDGFPFPVNEKDIENSYNTLRRALNRARTGQKEQMIALKNLARWHSDAVSTKNNRELVNISKRTRINSSLTVPEKKPVVLSSYRKLIQPELF